MKITHQINKNELTITLHGEMDHHSAKSIREEADRLIENIKPVFLKLELSKINFCDSSGLGFIMGRFKKITAAGGKIIVLNPSDAVCRIMKIAGMDRYIKIEHEVMK